MSGRILIVDDVATSRIVLKARLAVACYQLRMAVDGPSCLEAARADQPDVILINHRLADGDGLAALRQLRADPMLRTIPVVYLAPELEPELRLTALEAGADDFIEKPHDDQTLMARIRNLVRGRQDNGLVQPLGFAEEAAAFEGAGETILVGLAPETAEVWRDQLAAHLTSPIRVMTPGEALSGDRGADVFVLQADCTRSDGGLHLLSELRSRPATRHAAICIICTQNSSEGVAMGMAPVGPDTRPGRTRSGKRTSTYPLFRRTSK